VAFTRRFGEIEFNIFGERWSVPGSPEIVVVSNVTEDGRPIGVRRAGENWHSDMCYASRPPRGTMLYALEIPELFGLALGDTEFASTAAAYSVEPISRAFGLVAHPLELAAYPPDDIGIDPLQGRTQLLLIEVAVVGDPAADA
jgi:hypothetical protein